jgi:hypothetical protein
MVMSDIERDANAFIVKLRAQLTRFRHDNNLPIVAYTGVPTLHKLIRADVGCRQPCEACMGAGASL